MKMTNSKRLYELWKVNGKDPDYICEHKVLEDDLALPILDNPCTPCDGFYLGCKNYNSKGRRG